MAGTAWNVQTIGAHQIGANRLDGTDPLSAVDHINGVDAVDVLQEEWRRERPEIDTLAMGLMGRVGRLTRILERSLRDYFAEYGLEPWEFDVLATLRRAGDPYQRTMKGILRAALITSGAVTNRIDRMEAKGLVERVPAETDRRCTLVRLTPSGLRLIDEILTGHVANEERLFAGLAQEEQRQLSALLRKLLLSLNDTRDPTDTP